MTLFTDHDTDKGYHHTYTPTYQRELDALERRIPVERVFEIGVYHGGSLRAWKARFPNAIIYGMDIDPQMMVSEARIHTFVGDQKKADDLLTAVAMGPFAMIVDDGSHRTIDQFQALKYLWRSLCSGGIYVVEDLDLEKDSSLMNIFGMVVRGQTSDIRVHLGDPVNVRQDDMLILEKR